MMKKLFVPVLLALFAFSAISVAQEMKKEEGKKEAKHELKSVTCDPACGFMVRSHDEAELTAIVKEHAKKAHNMEMTDEQVKEKMKTEKMKKKMEKKM
jgi:predicted small metal-binding protein